MPQFPATDDLRQIENAGSVWASRCMEGLLSEKDVKFFATRYQPFFECLKEIEGRFHVPLADFDPFAQHKHCRTLFAPAFGTHGAVMISPSMNPLGKVPDFKFASFEAGVIRAIRRTWEDMKETEHHAKKWVGAGHWRLARISSEWLISIGTANWTACSYPTIPASWLGYRKPAQISTAYQIGMLSTCHLIYFTSSGAVSGAGK